MPAWPETLPQHVIAQGYGEAPPDLLARSTMETGPAARRRRFTAGETVITCQIALTPAQRDTLLAFVADDLKGGALSFTWVHPVTRAACTMIMEPPRITAETGASFLAALELRVQP